MTTVNDFLFDFRGSDLGMNAVAVAGLSEEDVALLFAFYSRNPGTLRERMSQLVERGDLTLPEIGPASASEKSKRFHERTTIGYGHKSVADHAIGHVALEGVSAVVERDFMQARLIAATSVSTRYVDFRDAGFVVPKDWPSDLVDEYILHCNELVEGYEGLKDIAVGAVRTIEPKSTWKSEQRWTVATEKRALDLIRDILPMSIKTSFGISASATSFRELLDKREYDVLHETRTAARFARKALRRANLETLLPEKSRDIERDADVSAMCQWYKVKAPYSTCGPAVRLVDAPRWTHIESTFNADRQELISGWAMTRPHKMGTNRRSEIARYLAEMIINVGAARDLGRQRMMTQLWSVPDPFRLGYGRDPMFVKHDDAVINVLANARAEILRRASTRLHKWRSRMPPEVLQYAMPMAANTRGVWELSLRQLVYVLGLRTVPQGHASYREVTQMLARAVAKGDPAVSALVDDVTNHDYITVGRPG